MVGYVIAQIDDVGNITLRPTHLAKDNPNFGLGYKSSFMHSWDWFIKNQIPKAKIHKGHIDYNWLVETIKTKYNNKTIRAFVFGKFLEEYGEDMLV